MFPPDSTKSDEVFLQRISPLVSGDNIYKKFSSKQLLSEKSFDPLNAEEAPPEHCGFGV